MVADGMSADEVLAAYPDLEPEDIREALMYAAEAVRERELPLSSAGRNAGPSCSGRTANAVAADLEAGSVVVIEP